MEVIATGEECILVLRLQLVKQLRARQLVTSHFKQKDNTAVNIS